MKKYMMILAIAVCVSAQSHAFSFGIGALKRKIQRKHQDWVITGMLSRAYERVPSILKGETVVDSAVRTTALGCVLYLAAKSQLHDTSKMKQIVLGLVGKMFDMFGIDENTATQFVRTANDTKEQLAQDVKQGVADVLPM